MYNRVINATHMKYYTDWKEITPLEYAKLIYPDGNFTLKITV